MQRFTPPATYSGSTTFFDGATFRGVLRTFGVVNPVNYFMLASFLAENWRHISAIYRKSSCSGSRPKFPKAAADGRAIEAASLTTKRKSQQHLASSYPIILSLDINRFYGSIYTHSIPWAVLGKSEAKRLYRLNKLKDHWSDDLDKLVRNCNQRQTVGIPIGPDTSRIISELLLSRIDAELCATGTGIAANQVYHNIDDFQIGVNDVGAAENAQSHFVRTISRYEFRLNDFKTSLDHGIDFVPSNFQRHFDILQHKQGRNFVEHFFELLYALIPETPQANVLGYALKRFALPLAKSSEQNLVREYLQRLIFAAPHQARWILPLLLGIYHQQGINPEIRRLFTWGIEACARRNDVGSLLWFLYGAIFLKIKLNGSICNQCIGTSNGLTDLVLFHGKSLGLFRFNVQKLRIRYKNEDFSSPAWLPLYEIERRGWDTSEAFKKLGTDNDKDNLYDKLRQNDVEFYLTDREFFSVEAFEKWNLKQDDFENDFQGRDRPQIELFFGNEFDEGWENYE